MHIKIPKFSDFLLFIIIGFMILFSADSIIIRSVSPENYQIIVMILTTLFIFYLLIPLIKQIKSIRANVFYILFFFTFNIVTTSLFNTNFSLGLIYLIAILVLVALVVNEYSVFKIVEVFNKFMLVICVISIVLFIVSISFNDILNFFPTYENSAGVKYKHFYLGAVFVERSDVRSIGVFREPGVFAVYIVIALIFELYIIKKSNYIKWIFILSLLLTFSTSGYIALMCLLFTHELSKTKLSKINVFKFLFLIIIVLFSISVLDLSFVFDKFDPRSNSYANFIARKASITVNLEIIKNNPLVGVGLFDYPKHYLNESLELLGVALKSGTQSTNTFFAQGAVFGFLSALLQVILFLIISLKIHKNNKINPFMWFGIFISLIIIFSSQDMRFSNIFNLLLFLSLSKQAEYNSNVKS
jgi:hypothetical protein